MSESDTCKRTFEITIPVEDVEAATNRVVAEFQSKARLPGFRPGKVPKSIVQSRFESDIRQQVLEDLVPQGLRKQVAQDNLKVVGTPNISEVHFHKGEPLRFKVDLEIAPEFELGEYRGLSVPYREPVVTDDDIDRRIEDLRERQAEFVNIDPRPVEKGDHAVVSLKSIAGVEGEPIEQDETVIEVGSESTLAVFNETLIGLEPGAEAEVEIAYPEDYANRRLAGRTVKFTMVLRGLRKKELPDVDDEFATAAGDYKNLAELRDDLRRQLLREREFLAQEESKHKLVEQLIDAHEFAVPEAFVEQQLRTVLEQQARELVARNIDPRSANIDWNALKLAQRDRAARDVRASLILERIADREAIETLVDEVDRELHKIAKQLREPVAAVRKRFEEDGTLQRIASRIRTDKVLNFLFEQSRKVAAAEEPAS